MNKKILSYEDAIKKYGDNIDAICSSLATYHGYTEMQGIECVWYEKNEKYLGCPECPLEKPKKAILNNGDIIIYQDTDNIPL